MGKKQFPPIFVMTHTFVATKYFWHDKTFVMTELFLWQKWYLWQLPPVTGINFCPKLSSHFQSQNNLLKRLHYWINNVLCKPDSVHWKRRCTFKEEQNPLFHSWDSPVDYQTRVGKVMGLSPCWSKIKRKKVQTNAYLFWHRHTVCKFSGKSPLSSHRTTPKQQINNHANNLSSTEQATKPQPKTRYKFSSLIFHLF